MKTNNVRARTIRGVSTYLLVAVLVIIGAVGFGISQDGSTNAATSPDGMTTGNDAGKTSVYYAYVDTAAGETLDVAFTHVSGGPMPIKVIAPDGTTAYDCQLSSGQTSCNGTDLTGAAGIYEIRIASGSNFYQYTWDYITVYSQSDVEITGRVWTSAFRNVYSTPIASTPVYSPTFYVVTDAGYTYRLTLREYNAFYGELAVNSTGLVVNKESCVSSYKSISADAHIADDYVNYNCGLARLFFEIPDPTLPTEALSASGMMKILPPLLSANNVVTAAPVLERPVSWQQAGNLVYAMDADYSGNYVVQVDTNNNGSFTDNVDLEIPAAAPGGVGNARIETAFDGKNGLGQNIPLNQTMRVRIYIGKIGEVHLVVTDAELNGGGVEIERLTGSGAPEYTIYYDDRDLTMKPEYVFLPNNLPFQQDGTAGVNSSGGVHGWWANQQTDVNVTSYGNNRLIDFWTYAGTSAYSNITIVGAVPSRHVEFIENGGSTVPDQTVAVGDPATEPTGADASTRENYDFLGWFIDDALTTPYDFSAPVNENITLYAKWQIKTYLVEFCDCHGNDIRSQQVNFGEAASAPESPQCDGQVFIGWDKKFDYVTGDLVVTAVYAPADLAFVPGTPNTGVSDEFEWPLWLIITSGAVIMVSGLAKANKRTNY